MGQGVGIPPLAQVLVSYLGVVYQRGFFDDSIFDYSSFASNCRYQDCVGRSVSRHGADEIWHQ